MTHNSTKASQTCSGRAVSRDAISSLNKEGAEKATAHWQGGVKLLDKTTYRFSNPPFFKLLSWAIFYHKHRKFVWPRRWSSHLTLQSSDLHWGLFNTCWAEGETLGRGGLPSSWIPGISGGYLSQTLDSVIDNTLPYPTPPPPKK